MPHVFGHEELIKQLGSKQDTTATFGEQGEIKSIKSKPILDIAGQAEKAAQEPRRPTTIPTLAEGKSATGGRGVLGGISDFLGSSEGTQVLSGIARGLDPQGVGGQLADVADSNLEAKQFSALTAKLEAGEEITSADVIGLSPESQQQAAGIIEGKASSARADRQVAALEEGVATKTEASLANIDAVRIRQEFDVNTVNEKIKLEQESLQKKLDAGFVSDTEKNASNERIARIRGDALAGRIAANEKQRRKVSTADIKLSMDLIKPLGVFKDLQATGDNRGRFDFSDATPDEIISRLGAEPMSNEKFMEQTSKTSLTVTEEVELEALRNFQGQLRTFQSQAAETNAAIQSAATSIPPESISAIDAYLRTKKNSKGEPVTIDDENRLRVFNNPTMRAAAGVN